MDNKIGKHRKRKQKQEEQMNEQNAVAVVDPSRYMSIKEISDRVNTVHEVFKRVLKKGVHYGPVPGCGKKDVLLKPGADVLAMTFRLVPQFEVVATNLPNDHREFTVTCSMYSGEGALLGQGVGSASTMEKKYRYRYEGGKWDPEQHKKVGATKIENEDIADVYNTVLKIAKKRSHIDATLTVTGAADMFTQDLIDEDDAPPRKPVTMPTEVKDKAAKSTGKPPISGSPGAKISEPQRKRLFAIADKANVSEEDLRLHLKSHGLDHSADIPRALYDSIAAWAERGGQEEPGDAKE